MMKPWPSWKNSWWRFRPSPSRPLPLTGTASSLSRLGYSSQRQVPSGSSTSFWNVYNFLFVLLCRLTQDALENLFSCVRSKNPVPRALEFKLTLRLIMVSQFFRPSKKGSYAVDERTQLLEFVELKKAACEEGARRQACLTGAFWRTKRRPLMT